MPTTWVWSSHEGRRRSIVADEPRFEPHFVVFYLNRQLVLAVDNNDVKDLHREEEGDPEWWK